MRMKYEVVKRRINRRENSRWTSFFKRNSRNARSHDGCNQASRWFYRVWNTMLAVDRNTDGHYVGVIRISCRKLSVNDATLPALFTNIFVLFTRDAINGSIINMHFREPRNAFFRCNSLPIRLYHFRLSINTPRSEFFCFAMLLTRACNVAILWLNAISVSSCIPVPRT